MIDQRNDDAPQPGRAAARRWPVWTGVGAAAAAIYVGPLLVFAHTRNHNWGAFWEAAATPYGTVTAGFAALSAGALAWTNGVQQRHNDVVEGDKTRGHLKAVDDRRHAAEVVRDLRTRFTTATDQLANSATTIQQAGAYALASLADDWLTIANTQEAQVCVNVLCTYLRAHHLSTGDSGGPTSAAEYDYTQPPPDQAVRDTIVTIITTHLQPAPDTGLWSHLSFDFTGAHFYDPNFSGAHFGGTRTLFNRAQFHGEHTAFFGTQFKADRTWFIGTQFHGEETWFYGARFHSRDTSFGKAHFLSKTTSFEATQFHSKTTSFGEAQFHGKKTWFIGAQFHGEDTSFSGARFQGVFVSFGGITVDADATVNFQDPGAWTTVAFDWDDDSRQVPPNVRPQHWPPTVVQ